MYIMQQSCSIAFSLNKSRDYVQGIVVDKLDEIIVLRRMCLLNVPRNVYLLTNYDIYCIKSLYFSLVYISYTSDWFYYILI